jgi:hypothetical protein
MSDFYDALVAELDREPSMCRCGHPLHAGRCTARWEHDSGSDVCPCEEGR